MRRPVRALGCGIALVIALCQVAPAAAAEDRSEQAFASSTESAAATEIRVAVPVIAETSLYVLGAPAPVSATVTPAGASGAVEFYDGGALLGAAAVDEDGRARIDTDGWAGSGVRAVTAHFVPDSDAHLPSTSAIQLYRVVDTTRVVPDVEVGPAVAEITEATLEWSIANIWFSNFSVGFEREVVSGDVTLPETTVGSTAEERIAYFRRPFTFHEGIGRRDAAGNEIVSFTGSAQLTSGSANRWVFTDPEVRVAVDGSGYITAVFSGFYRIGETDQQYGPVRVTIATFSDSDRSDGDGIVRRADLNWEGQANGPGTWAFDFDASFPNEFVALLNPGIHLFFAASGVATDSSKAPLPITLSYREDEVMATPVITTQPQDVRTDEGADARFAVEVDSAAPFAVRWQQLLDGGWQDVPGGSGAQLVLSTVGAGQDGSVYRAVVEAGDVRLFSEQAVLRVIPADAGAGEGQDGSENGGSDDGEGEASEADAPGELSSTGAEPAEGIAAAGLLLLIVGLALMLRRRIAR